MNLSPTQKRAYDLSMTGSSLLITGSAGTGKSYLLKHIYNGLTGMNKKVAITALTGCAAYLLTEDLGIKVHTIHSWVGFGYGDDEAKNYITKINKTHPLRQRWRHTDTLIIDEISMMSATTFDKIEQIARGVRGKDWGDRPFGGLQVICVGDFYQLPPVVRQSYSAAASASANTSAVQALFAFQAQSWPTVIKHTVVLETIYRQNDPHFQKILEEARHGQLSEASIDALKERTTVDWKKNAIKPTLVFTKRAVVEDINRRNLDVLKGTKYSYSVKTLIEPRTTIRGIERLSPDDVIIKDAVAKLDADATYVAELTLCKKAQVMLIKNIDVGKGLVNGSRGVIVDFAPVEISSSTGWEENSQSPACGEAIEATMNGFIRTVRSADPEKRMTKIERSTCVYYPIVLFVGQTEPMLIEPHAWASKMEESVSRSQIPLVLAWAVTTHKIQGATLDCALIDIGDDVFEYGQAYVALSRVKSLDSLYVHNLVPSCVRAHPLVKEFYKSVKETESALAQEQPHDLTQEENPTNHEAEREKTSIPPKNYFSIFKPARTLGQ